MSFGEFRVINVVLVFYDTYLRGKGLLERMKKSLICFRAASKFPGLSIEETPPRGEK